MTPLEEFEAEARRAARREASALHRKQVAARRRAAASVTLAFVAAGVLVGGFLALRALRAGAQPSGDPASVPATTAALSSANPPEARAATLSTAATVPASPAVDPTGSTVATAAASAESTAWEKPYLGKLVAGFRPKGGYKAVALTFDDGPNQNTRYVIKTLQKYHAVGTFFDTGKNLQRRDGTAAKSAAMIAAAGFEMGDHTQDHMPNNVSAVYHKTYAQDVYEITNPDKLISRYVPWKTVWLRPPGGGIDAMGVRAANDTGHLVINWTVDSNDSHGGPRTPDYIFQMCTTNIKSGDVILMHVTHPESMQALPRIAAALTQQGFKLVTVTELAKHSTPITQRVR